MFRSSGRIILFLMMAFAGPLRAGTPLTIEKALAEAEANNPDLRSARERMLAARAEIWQSVSPSRPHLFREWEETPASAGFAGNWGVRKTGVEQEFQFPLLYLQNGIIQQRNALRAQAEYHAVKNRIGRDVKINFYRLLFARKKKELKENNLNLISDTYQKARMRVLSGESSPYDSLKVRVDLTVAENELFAAEEEVRIASKELTSILGRNHEDDVIISGALEVDLPQLSEASLEKTAREMHPDIIMAQAELSRNRALLAKAWTSLLPDVSVRYFQQDIQSEPDTRYKGMEVSLSLPIWLPFQERGRIESATYQKRAADYARENTEKMVLLRLDKSLAALRVAQQQARNFKESSLKQVDELVRIASTSYQEGEMSYLELSEALHALNQVTEGYYQALFNVRRHMAELEEAVAQPLFQNNETE